MISKKVKEPYEYQYIEILKNIMSDGYKQLNERTNVETIRIPHAVITVNLQNEFPILKTKNVLWKSALKEILWIMQRQSNNINDLDSKIWDAWADDTGSIGKAYGYQVAKDVVSDGIIYPSQVHYVLNRLSADSSDRRAVIDLWNVDDLKDMNLAPCCFTSIWNVIDDKLNCALIQRSGDFLVGVPFNTTQYAILTHLFARHLGVQVGQLTHVIVDSHIYCYESHLSGAKKMINNYQLMDDLYYVSSKTFAHLTDKPNDFMKKMQPVIDSEPRLEINSSDTDFFSISVDDISVENYAYIEKIAFDVAV